MRKTSQFSRFNFHLSGFESVLLWLIWNSMLHLGGRKLWEWPPEICSDGNETFQRGPALLDEWMSNSLHYYWLCLEGFYIVFIAHVFLPIFHQQVVGASVKCSSDWKRLMKWGDVCSVARYHFLCIFCVPYNGFGWSRSAAHCRFRAIWTCYWYRDSLTCCCEHVIYAAYMNRYTYIRSRQVELGEVEGFRGTLIALGQVYSEHWTILFKCWANNLIGCRISIFQLDCAMK